MDSILSASEDDDEAAFVRAVYAEWESQVPDEEDIANGAVSGPKEPIESCTQNDVARNSTVGSIRVYMCSQ